jgi:hypothetical protein
MSAPRWLLAACALLAACGPRPAAAGPQSCGPSDATLDAGAAGASLQGSYRVRLVATSGPRRDSSTDGALTLARPDSAAADTSARRPVLVGSGDLALAEVGAAEADLASRDPMRPGVLVFDLGARSSGGPNARVLLRLGAEANRQDVVRVEGAYTVLWVHEIRDDGFAGSWTSGAPLPVAEGYFCAWREVGSAE